MDDRPRVTIENCHTLAAECCAYYAHILKTYDRPNRDPCWHQMRDVAETWRRALDCDSAPETDIEELEIMIQPMWTADQCATTWIYMATGIDLWLRSIGRPGIGPNPWYGERIPNDVRPMGF